MRAALSNRKAGNVADFARVNEKLSLSYVQAFLEGLGIDPADVASFEVLPRRLIVTRYIRTASGAIQLDHLGPRTVESHFHIRK